MGVKDKMMVYGDNPDERVKIIPTEKGSKTVFCLKDAHILQLAQWVMQDRRILSALKNNVTPMDVEWAVDGLSKELFIVQARPETIHSRKDHSKIIEYSINDEQQRHKRY